MRRLVLLALLFAAIPSTAFAACPSGARCGSITVPLDHSGGTPGTLPLAYATLPAIGEPLGTLVLLTGGPGEPGISYLSEFAQVFDRLRPSYDILTFDQRGTGDSGAVACDTVAECADRLGARRAFLTTPETARDLEDLRAALGIEKLTLVGISYGAKVAGEYARRFPARTAAVVLDSPAPIDGLDAVNALRVLAAPRVLREVCHPGLCDATVPAPDEALADAAARVQRGAVSGARVKASGQVRTGRATEAMLFELLINSDTDPSLRAGLPAAIASLAAGDAAPLLHLDELAGEDEESDVNLARFLATMCVEGRLPWAPDSPLATRAAARAAFDRSFAPFRTATVLDQSATALCEAWPPTPRPEAVAQRGPDVPVLVLAGRDDLRTPLEDARRTAGQYPRAKLLAIPFTGHATLFADPMGCAPFAVVNFLEERAVQQCSTVNRQLDPPVGFAAAPYAPAEISRLPALRLPGLPGRTLSAISVTLTGVAFDAAATGRQTFRLPGLRAGYVRATRSRLELHGVEWIRGVRVSGRLDARGRGSITVSGPSAAPGTVTYGASSASGTLGGSQLHADPIEAGYPYRFPRARPVRSLDGHRGRPRERPAGLHRSPSSNGHL